MEKLRVLVLGVGNILLSDEGFGVAAVNRLMRDYDWPDNVRLLDGGTLGLFLMPDIMDADFLVVLDVVLGPGAPGTIYLLEGEDLRKSLSFRDSTHQTDLVDTLISCELAGGRPDAVIIGIQPGDWQTLSPALTPELEARLPEFCAKVAAELARRGITATPRQDPGGAPGA
ncbi:HyaD/HybD family hydrogenase maturation endopeptidase [Desulfovibrio sp.]|uniref:HyaD/HybD family hydrogenase maturation endopeptidase n=1 Tax=Desulfovibrio sp. TaxID=885 RepID=UPI0023BC51CC|nr:HyaD/HybD family hydrogenase maturation endopeptidase [Desulfovibrio sp.]MDE7242227.1 HyaD/HybD family hydrogenase maturation endopeptidase [Desulfovibrio sp.]